MSIHVVDHLDGNPVTTTIKLEVDAIFVCELSTKVWVHLKNERDFLPKP